MVVINLFKKYDVALSFAEEDRPSVDRVVKLLKEQSIKIFYDDDLRIASWGKYLKNYLDKAYRLQAEFCVVFVSEDYERKRWTKFELGRAQARSFFQKNKTYLLPYLLDDSEFSEQFKDVGCLTHRTHNEEALAEAIIAKLNQQQKRRFIAWLKDLYRIKRRLVAAIILLLGGTAFWLKNHLTPVDTLTRKIYNDNKRSIKGAMCNDSTFSTSHGPGTCSHHDGVAYYLDSVIYDKTIGQSKEEAEETSWLDP